MRKVQLKRGFCLRFLPYREKRKIMERETKREKREIFAWEVAQGERQEIWVFFEIYGLANKSKRICNACINTEKYHRHI
jgi:hypothetical protein